MHAIALVTLRSRLVIDGGNVLDRLRRRGREAVRQSEFSRNTSRNEFTVRRIQLVDAYWSEANRCRDAVPEESGLSRTGQLRLGTMSAKHTGQVTRVGIDESARYDAPLIKCLSKAK